MLFSPVDRVLQHVSARRSGYILKMASALILVSAVLAGCSGGDIGTSDELPPMPPTATPIPPTPAPTIQAEPEVELEGEILDPLDDGQEIVAGDQRYSIVIPNFWVQGTAPTADIAYRESGAAATDHGYSYNVMREQLPDDVRDAWAYAESGRAAAEAVLPEIETISMEPVQVGTVQGVRWIYTTRLTTDTVMVHQTYIVDGRTGFLLTGSAPADGDLNAARSLFDSISGSFSFPRG